MLRFLTFAITALLVAFLAVPASADSSMPGGTSMQHTCPVGQKWVKGYKKKSGAQVKGYCRGGKAASAKTTPVGTQK